MATTAVLASACCEWARLIEGPWSSGGAPAAVRQPSHSPCLSNGLHTPKCLLLDCLAGQLRDGVPHAAHAVPADWGLRQAAPFIVRVGGAPFITCPAPIRPLPCSRCTRPPTCKCIPPPVPSSCSTHQHPERCKQSNGAVAQLFTSTQRIRYRSTCHSCGRWAGRGEAGRWAPTAVGNSHQGLQHEQAGSDADHRPAPYKPMHVHPCKQAPAQPTDTQHHTPSTQLAVTSGRRTRGWAALCGVPHRPPNCASQQ